MVRLWWLWWPQPARPPPQRWHQAAVSIARHPQGLRRHSPTPLGAAVVAVPSSDRHHDGGVGGVMGWIGMMETSWWQRRSRRKKVGVRRKNPPEKMEARRRNPPENFSGGGAGQWRLPEMGEEGEREF
ncbi:hypothetical protein Tco_0114607 [Tanacetum coccineum]